MRSVPGGPFSAERALEPEIEANMLKRYHLDEPLWKQYLRELSNIGRGDLGYSYKLADFSVGEVMRQGFPISASLGIFAMTFALILGLTAGVVSAVWRGSPFDFSLMTLATIGIAVPNFTIAGVAIILFVFLVPLFPAGGWGTLSHLVLPGFCLGAPYAAYIARLTRTGMLDVLSQDYIRTARAKGLSTPTVIVRHALRGALLPVVSYLGPATADILTGSLVIEQIFAIPGLGAHFIQAALQRDYTLSMGVILLYAVLLCLANLLVDLSYGLLDPRVKLE
ncbi:MAG: ABC transporter permease [Pirellulales bacterium]|nr:ABC transporter permease [Pirellulales bacterium]